MNIQEKSIITPLPDDILIAEKEKKWRLLLPNTYKEFLKKYNGGIPQENSFNHAGHNYVITRFLGIVRDIKASDLGWYDIGVVESQIGERLTNNMDLIGMEVMPIAELFGNDYICLDFRDSIEKPVVCIWYHEESTEFAPITEKVADGFDEFIEILHKQSMIRIKCSITPLPKIFPNTRTTDRSPCQEFAPDVGVAIV